MVKLTGNEHLSKSPCLKIYSMKVLSTRSTFSSTMSSRMMFMKSMVEVVLELFRNSEEFLSLNLSEEGTKQNMELLRPG